MKFAKIKSIFFGFLRQLHRICSMLVQILGTAGEIAEFLQTAEFATNYHGIGPFL